LVNWSIDFYGLCRLPWLGYGFDRFRFLLLWISIVFSPLATLKLRPYLRAYLVVDEILNEFWIFEPWAGVLQICVAILIKWRIWGDV
jgi:hypothetical protein